MILATITITTGYGKTTLAVEVLGKGSGPATARVKALGGLEPFTKMSHGGPFQSSTEIFPLASIRDIHVQMEPGWEREKLFGLEPVTRQVVAAGEGDYDAHASK